MPKTTVNEKEVNSSTTDETVTMEVNVMEVTEENKIEILWGKIKNKLHRRKMKKAKKKIEEKTDYNKINIKSRASLVLIIALLVFVVSSVIKFANSGHTGGWYTVLDITASLIESVSGIILGLSVGNMSLDFFSYADYMKDRIKEVIVEKSFLDKVSDDEKYRMIEILESSLYFNNEPLPPDSLYYNVKNKIIPLYEKQHYEKTYTYIDCKVENGKIYKEIYNEITLFNYEDNKVYKLPCTVYYDKNDILDIEKPYNISDVRLNNDILKLPDIPYSSEDDVRDVEKTKFSFEYPIQLKKGKNIISYVVNSVVNESDNIYSKTITVPCKNCIVEMQMENDDYTITGLGYAIDKIESINIRYINKMCRIECRDWIIPGDGFIFVINAKK